jgi:hypothetical protein
MDNQFLGGLVGLGLGIVGYVTIGRVIGQVEARAGNRRDPESQRIVSVLKAVRLLDLILLPAVCYFAFGFIEVRIIG